MTNHTASFAASITPSLQGFDENLEEHLRDTQYWATLETPDMNVSLTAPLEQSATRYLTYKPNVIQSLTSDPEVAELLRQVNVTPSVQQESRARPQLPYKSQTQSQNQYTQQQTQQMKPRAQNVEQLTNDGKGNPPTRQHFNSDDKPRKLPPKPVNEEAASQKWDDMLARAKKALGIKTPLQTSEETIMFAFERLLAKTEELNTLKQLQQDKKKEDSIDHTVKGDVLKSIPKTAKNDSEAHDVPVKTGLAAKYGEDAKPVTLEIIQYSPEEQVLKASIDTLPKQKLGDMLISCSRLLPSTPSNALEIPQLMRAVIKNSPQVIKLQNQLLLAHEKLSSLYQQIEGAPELQRYCGFSEKLETDFALLAEKQEAAVLGALADHREQIRFRNRVAELLGVKFDAAKSVYDSIKLNGQLYEKLRLQQNNSTDVPQHFLAADEFLSRFTASLDPREDVDVCTVTDTLLNSSGRQREVMSQQALKAALADNPKILIRLTEPEAYQAIQVIIFVLRYFQKLFQVNQTHQLLSRISEVHTFAQTSKALLRAVRANLGLQESATANKIIQAVQALSQRAVGSGKLLEICEELGCEVDEVVEKVRAMK